MLIGTGVAFVVGTAVGGYAWPACGLLAMGACLSALLAAAAVWAARSFAVAWAAVMASVVLTAAFHARVRSDPPQADVSHPRNPLLARLRGAVDDLPSVLPSRGFSSGIATRFRLSVEAVRSGGRWTAARGKVRVTVRGQLAGLGYGERVEVTCRLDPVRGPLNPGEPDLRAAWSSRGILATAWCPGPDGVRRAGTSGGSPLWRAIYWVKRRIRDRVDAGMEEDQAAVVRCLVLGDRDAMDWSLRRPFIQTGTMHFLAVSGLHVGIVGGFAWWVLAAIGVERRTTAAAVMALLVGYAVMAGLRPPIVRATVMGLVICAGAMARKTPYWPCTLAAAAIAVLLVRPAEIHNLGFQLSFAAVSGIMLLTLPLLKAVSRQVLPLEPLEPRRTHVAAWSLWHCFELLRQALVVSFAAWAATAPLLAMAFKTIVPAAPLMSLVLLPQVWLLLMAAIPGVLAGFVWPGVGALFLRVSEWAAGGMLNLSSALESLPGTRTSVVPPAWWWVAGYYALLAMLAFRERLRLSMARCAIVTLALAAVVVWADVLRPVGGPMRAAVLDVRDGHATLVRTPAGATILYGAGGHSRERVARRVIDALYWLGDNKIDLAIVPSAAASHGNALGGIADLVHIGAIVTTPAALARPSGRVCVYPPFKRGVRVLQASAGDHIRGVPGATIHVLHPPRDPRMCRKLGAADTVCAVRIASPAGSLLLAPTVGPSARLALRRSGSGADVAVTDKALPADLRAQVAIVRDPSPSGGGPRALTPQGAAIVTWGPDGFDILAYGSQRRTRYLRQTASGG